MKKNNEMYNLFEKNRKIIFKKDKKFSNFYINALDTERNKK